MSNYPPGVSGFELEISGAEREWEDPAPRDCPRRGCEHTLEDYPEDVSWFFHRHHGFWWVCPVCDDAIDEDDPDEPDPDRDRE